MRQLTLFILCTLLISYALAEPVTISWKHPTMRTDGTPLDPSEIAETRLWCLNINYPPDRFIPGSETSVILDLPLGVHSCYAKTVLIEKAADGKLLISAASTPVEFTVQTPAPPDPARPNAPGEMKVTQIVQQ